MRYYIADTHFFHRSLNEKMDQRGFDDIDQMNEYMIDQWNSKVRKNDEVVVLGDFSWGNAKETTEILDELKGKIYLIRGNHDRFLDDKNFDTSRSYYLIIQLLVMMGNIEEMSLGILKLLCCMDIFMRRKISSFWMLIKIMYSNKNIQEFQMAN